MSETKQHDSEVHNQDHDFLRGVVNYIDEHEFFKGTASELGIALGVGNMNARALSLKLEKIKTELKNSNIFVRHAIIRGRHVVTLSDTPNSTHKKQTSPTTNKHTPLGGVAKSEEPITFPFSWVCGQITELSKEEKIEVNALRCNGRKSYQKMCSLCGEVGVLEFRKTSDCSSSLICESCAVGYARSALKLQEEHGVGRDVM